jgi:tetratricopeptide (TPR) repeat protein
MAISEFASQGLKWTVAVGALTGCGGALPPSEVKAAPKAELPSQFQNKCDAAKGQLRPLVVEWAAPDRAALEAMAQHGQLVVRYEGCTFEVLRGCSAPASFSYRYTAITPKAELVTMKSADELYASIPVHAASFEGKLSQQGQLNAAMTIVGTYEAPNLAPAADELSGECANATHVVAALTVGAFEFFAGDARAAGAQASLLGAGAGAKHEASHETLSRDGSVEACKASKRGDASPPESCGALLRVELAPIRPAGAGLPTCEPGTKLVGRECTRIEKPSELAPGDRDFVDDQAGIGWGNRCYTHFQNGLLPYARAACQKALESDPVPKTSGAVYYNLGLIEEATGDVKAACQAFRDSLAFRPSVRAVKKKFDELSCRDVLSK